MRESREYTSSDLGKKRKHVEELSFEMKRYIEAFKSKTICWCNHAPSGRV